MARQQGKPTRLGWVLLAVLAGAVLAGLTQQAAAASLASAMAGLWVSAMSVVLRLIAAIFGGS